MTNPEGAAVDGGLECRRSLERSRRRRALQRAASCRRRVRRRRRSAVSLSLVVAMFVASGLAVAHQRASSSGERPATPTGLLTVGSRGAAVETLQRALGITADGVFGAQTARAVRHFQRDRRLLVDGVVGPQTAGALGLTLAAPVPSHPAEHSHAHAASSGVLWPVQGPITTRFGGGHAGIDVAASAGTPVRAAASGTVSTVQSPSQSGGYGNYSCVAHAGGISTCYAHQASIATSPGATVQQGQVIGAVGCTGRCTGNHLHFEVRRGSVPSDPLASLGR